MRRHLFIAASLLALIFSPAKAADSTVSAMTAASALGGSELLYVVQAAADRKGTPAQMATYVYGLMSGDCTVAASVITCTKTGGVAFSTLATTTPAAGVATFLTTPSSANLLAALTTKTGTGNAVFGSAPTIDSLNATTAMTLAFLTGGGTQCVTVSNTGVVGGTACSGGGSVTTLTPGAGLVSGITASCTQTNITVTGTLSAAECINAQTGASYAIVDGDRGKLVTGSNAAAQAYSIAQAGTGSAFANGWYVDLYNKGVGTLTVTPTTSTINGAATYALFAGQGVRITSDGTNYQINPGTSGGVTVSVQSGANYPIVASDFGKLLFLSNASNQIPTLPVASAVGANWFVQACNDNAGTQTITPTTSTIGGAATYVLPAGAAGSPQCVAIVSDGTNYRVVPDFFRVGSGVATAAAIALSGAGGLTSTIASGTSALGTGAISSATCATVVTTAATNTATTDVVSWGFNGDPTAVTGYVPLVAGMLTIIAYPTANNANFKVCNNTNASVTPGAITLNWRVMR